MKDFGLLIWLTQLGLSVAIPLAGFTLIGAWLHSSAGFGQWTIWCGMSLGLISAIGGLRDSLKAMERMAKGHKKEDPPPVAFNDHK